MQELRLVAVSEDGTYLVLASAGRGTRFMLPVDDRLRAAVRGQFSRLGQYEIEVENPLRPKEIQARIRSGETAEAIAEHAGIPIERVRWFEGPVLQEREYIAQQAQRATVRRQGESAPGPTLGDTVAQRIGAHQLETGDAVWDSWKREDNTWQLKLAFLAAGEEKVAHWVYEPRRRSVTPADDEAVRFSSPDADGPRSLGGGANVTPFVPRRNGAPTAEPARPDPAPAPAPAPQRPEPLTATAPTRPEPPRPDIDGPLPAAPPEEPAPPARPERTPVAGRVPIVPEHTHPAAREDVQAPPRTAPAEPPRRGAPLPATGRADAPEPVRPERPVLGHPAADPAGSPAARRPAPGTPPPAAHEPERPAPHTQEPSVPAAAAQAPGAAAPPSRRKGRGRRASVPSWDEIMFGAKKPD
ncbi:septation protein SepH [Nocardiopsis sediminis]|uniref:Septation protein SepH n=1 Tax=Nocardiopsis sediminis TaxID=1778267 RepID=A0ABV8FSY3_9ACTN